MALKCDGRTACAGLRLFCDNPSEYPQYFERAYQEKYIDGNFVDVHIGWRFRDDTCPVCGQTVPAGFLILAATLEDEPCPKT